MLYRSFSILIVLVISALLPWGPALAQTADRPITQAEAAEEGAAGGLIVTFAPSAADGPRAAADLAPALSRAAGVKLAFQRPMTGGAYVYRFERVLTAGAARAAAARLRAAPGVAAVEPDWRFHIALAPNDSLYSQMWNLAPATAANYGIDAPAAWDITTGDPDMMIAVLDTGILKLHPDLIGRFVAGYDFISNTFTANDGDGRDADAADAGDWVTQADINLHSDCGSFARPSSWHGSHVAGTIAAAANNGQGIAGVNWNSKILPVRVLGKCGGSYSDIAEAIRWAAGLPVIGVPNNPTPAKIINMSLGGPSTEGCPTLMQQAINDAMAAGTIVVAAAGNSTQDAANFTPANCTGVITVGASEQSGYMAYYSNFGPSLEINAPGGDRFRDPQILSTINDSDTTSDLGEMIYYPYQGTSMAAPHVAGIVSLMLSANPGLTRDQIVNLLQTTATPMQGYSPTQECGTLCGQAGVAHAGRAVQAAESLQIVLSPTEAEPYYAGVPAAAPAPPNVIQAVLSLSTTPAFHPNMAVTALTVGGQNAVITNVDTSTGQEVITAEIYLSPPAAGYYDLGVTRDGITYTVPRGVLFGVLPRDDAFTVAEDSPAAPLVDPLANDLGAAETGAVIHSVSPAANGQVTLQSGQIIYQPNPNFTGVDTFTYSVLNGSSPTSATITVTVTDDQADPPVIAAIGDFQAPSGLPLQFTVSALDPDAGETLTLSVTHLAGDPPAAAPLPAGAVFDPSARVFQWTPTDDQVSPTPYTFVFTVTDHAGLSDQETVEITVVSGATKLYLAAVNPVKSEYEYTGYTSEALPMSFKTNADRSEWRDFILVAFVSDPCYTGNVRFSLLSSGPITNGQFVIEDGTVFRVTGTINGSEAYGTFTFINFPLTGEVGCSLLNKSGLWYASAE